MAKYRVIRDKYERYGSGGIISSTFTADSDLEAILKVDENCGYGYPFDEDEEGNEIMPTLEEAIHHLSMNNGDGADYIMKIENVDTGNVLFEEDDGYIEEEEDW
jgi:hypothetical protein